MSKLSKIQKKPAQLRQNNLGFVLRLSNLIKRKGGQYALGTVAIIFLIYSFSLFRPWLPYDERLIYKENFFPIPNDFGEIKEIIQTFTLKTHLLSLNNYFSNLGTLRCCPLTSAINTIALFLFKKNAFLFHCLQLTIHLLNSMFLFLIIRELHKILAGKALSNNSSYLLISLVTIIWSIHSANTEAVLLVTNWTAIFSFTICFLFIFLELRKISNQQFTTSRTRILFLSLSFFGLMFLSEYGYPFPLILFLIVFPLSSYIFKSLKKGAIYSLKISIPYFLGLLFFLVISLSSKGSPISNVFSSQNLSGLHSSPFYVFLERNLWLSPQLFIHFLKTMFFPKILSTYQSNLVNISEALVSRYSLFSIFAYISFLILPIVLFLVYRKKAFSILFIELYAFFIAMLPFLHILAPTYCLNADRYNYFPSFIFSVIIFQSICFLIKNPARAKVVIYTFALLALLLTVRTTIRIYEWNDPFRLYKSAVNAEKNPLYKGHRLSILADYLGSQGNENEMHTLLKQSLKSLEKAKKYYKRKVSQTSNQPVTLKFYGLDYNSLFLKTVYTEAYIKNDNFQESPKIVLSSIEQCFDENLQFLPINLLSFYAEMLNKVNQAEKEKNILEYAYKKYPFSEDLALKLSDLYLNSLDEPEKAFHILQDINLLFPNNSLVLSRILKYYDLKNDSINQGKIAYLIGLKEHSVQAYQKAAKIYLDLNMLDLAHKSLIKLSRLKSEDPLTYLLVGRYLDLSGKRSQLLPVLNSALIASYKLGDHQDFNITKSILISLIKVNASQGKLEEAKKYIKLFEEIKDLKAEDRAYISSVKKEVVDLENKIRTKSASG